MTSDENEVGEIYGYFPKNPKISYPTNKYTRVFHPSAPHPGNVERHGNQPPPSRPGGDSQTVDIEEL